MASQSQVPPLRIQKGGNGSPNKLPISNTRPLSELSAMAIRRNSPSFPQGKMSTFKNESSPANSSPFGNSPHAFWRGRDVNSPARENYNPLDVLPSPPPAKRSSIENLKKASRVKNSSMFEREQKNHYDPARPSLLDGRPSRSSFLQSSESSRPELSSPAKSPFGSPSPLNSPNSKPLDEVVSPNGVAPLSPSKSAGSPAKSSLSKKSGQAFRHSAFDPDTGIWEDDDDTDKRLPEGRVLHRHAKSVTFDQAPPQVNEYEMTTPDPSSVASGSREGSYESDNDDDEELSFERGSSMDHDDSFDASLEDTEKTPVVLPEDWRFMSPDNARSDLSKGEEDVFDDDYGSPEPSADPGALAYRPHQTSVNSVDSNGERRPLPPLPPGAASPRRSPGRDSLSGTIERMSNPQRNLPSPPLAASVSKSDIRRMSGGGFSLNDRLRLMMNEKEQDTQRERRMRRAGSKDASPTRSESQDFEDAVAGEPGPEIEIDNSAPSHISRESILRHMRSEQDLQDRLSDDSRTPSQASMYDPDIPIPSLEDPTQNRDEDSVVIKTEDDDDTDLYDIPDLYARQADLESEVSDDDLPSEYSQPSLASVPVQPEEGQDTPRALSPAHETQPESTNKDELSLPDFMADFGQDQTFDSGLESYMTPPREQVPSLKTSTTSVQSSRDLPDLAALRTSIQRPYTPQEQLEAPQPAWESDEPGTPNSVIRHPTQEPRESISPLEDDLEDVPVEEPVSPVEHPSHSHSMSLDKELPLPPQQSPSISPEPSQVDQVIEAQEATTTESAPEEVNFSESQNARISSLVQLEIPKDQSDEGLSFGLEKEFDRVVESQKVEFERSLQHLYYPFNGRFPSAELPDTKDSRVKYPVQDAYSLPRPRGARSPLETFANRRTKQRGYLMRQNTKVVVATERTSQDEPHMDPSTLNRSSVEPNEVVASPRKTSQPTWTAEPWNGKSRRKSIRIGGEAAASKKKAEGPAPPLPGQASNVDGLGSVTEDDLAEEEAEDFEDGAERGRLFVKVIGVKDLQLPFPQHEHTSFALTLDNGLHCVTTAWLDLARDAPIGQEFELVVLNDLEFQLTLQMKLEEPKVQRPQSPSKPPTSPKKSGAFGRLFGSPKKKEKEAPPAIRNRPVTPPSFYELVEGLVAKDGSFARAYINLSEHEKKAYGRPYSVDITCFNEWAMEQVSVGSHRSKRGAVQLQRRPPYEIGKLELLLLYIPKPKGAKDEDMPKSMNGAVRAMREAEERSQQQASIKDFEGHLSQQGGDCPYWRRRFFKLQGTKLTAYHEATRQPRATINLAKAAKLIDDKTALIQKETSAKGGGRRRSAFAEEEEGYMFVEEGFRIRFANGEVIDFYADSTAAKDEWMHALSQVVGKGITSGSSKDSKAWTDMVLKREKSTMRRQTDGGRRGEVPVRTSSAQHQQQQQPDLQPTAPAPAPAPTPAPVPTQRPKSPVRPKSPFRPKSPVRQQTAPMTSSIPSPAGKRPAINSRQSTGHLRMESFQQLASGVRSQANSPVKTKFGFGMSSEERRRKARSMLM